MGSALLNSECPDLELVARGKVRDVYGVDDRHLLFVATDRLSAFDVVMTNGIPDKGKILTQLSVYWFDLLAPLGRHHLVATELADMPKSVQAYGDQLDGRCLLVERCRILPVEAIVRGYLAGSGWKEYRSKGTVCDIPLPDGLIESDRLPAPLFTPSTKADIGDHDENISPEKAAEIIGADHAAAVEAQAIACYEKAHAYAAERGLILADTKFEFGIADNGDMILADEVLTPDSSRYWPADDYEPGRGQQAFDKQYVRDWLEDIGFDKQTPIALPEEVIAQTRSRYIDAYRLITGSEPRI
jgi:phosphoribosylaminoimidazole-succinocarboxamide synthase